MLNFPQWKVAAIGLICLAGLIFTIPNLFPRATVESWPAVLPRQQINLGLDLQGGSHLLLEVDTPAVVRERLETLVDDVRVTLRRLQDRVGYRGLGVEGDTVTLELRDPAQADAVRTALAELDPNPLQPELEIDVADSGRFTLRLTETAVTERINAAIEQSLEIVRRRIDEVGTREPTIQRQGRDRILVQVPGEKDPEAIKRLLGQTAKLTFHLVDLDTSLAEAERGALPPGSELMPAYQPGEGEQEQYVVRRRVVVSGENLVDAQPSFQDNQPVVSFRFDTAGARRFGEATQENVGQLLAIVLDDAVISAPRIREPILGGSGVISGNFTTQTANELAILLRAGALPAPLNVVEERTVGPDLGADSIRAGAIASVLGFVAVAAFMIFYYGRFGVVAAVGLVVNLILILGALSVLGATLTLPGIAGIVLTIGMAVDSNVLIFERIREEVQNGRTPLAALDSGFREAMRAIIDANVTTLIAALVLFFFGSGPIRGFAVTLSIGVVTTMFTAIVFSRMLLALWYRRARPAALPV